MLLHRIHLIFYQIRRLCNICFLFKNHNIKSMSKLAKKFNIKTQDLKYICNNILKDKHDCPCIDESRPEEFRLRKNVYELIKLPQY